MPRARRIILALTACAAACAAPRSSPAPRDGRGPWTIESPDERLRVELALLTDPPAPGRRAGLHVRASYAADGANVETVAWSPLGFAGAGDGPLRLVGDDRRTVADRYTRSHGKQIARSVAAGERRLTFAGAAGRLTVAIRCQGDGFAIRQALARAIPGDPVPVELTELRLPTGAQAWLADEGFGPARFGRRALPAGGPAPRDAGFALPGLFVVGDPQRWLLFAEAGLAAGDAGSFLGAPRAGAYPLRRYGARAGAGGATSDAPTTIWTPWRVFVIGARPAALGESSLVYDLAPPAQGDFSWVKVGPDAGGSYPHVALTGAGPERRALLRRLAEAGNRGVRVFVDDLAPATVTALIETLHDAAATRLLVALGGSIAGRGWERTFPHLLSSGLLLLPEPPQANAAATMHAFAHGAVGSLELEPVTLRPPGRGRRATPIPTWTAAVALPLFFDGGLPAVFDPESRGRAAPEALAILDRLPRAWDETRFLVDEPGARVVIARRCGRAWYLAGLAGPGGAEVDLALDGILGNGTYDMVLVGDGRGPTDFLITKRQRGAMDVQRIMMLPRGGFLMTLEPLR